MAAVLYWLGMVTVAAAAVTAIGAIFATWLGTLASRIKRELDECEHDRKQLRQILQLVVSSLVGLLPEAQRIRLLAALDEALEHDAGE